MTILGYLAMLGLGLCLCAIAGVYGFKEGWQGGWKVGYRQGHAAGKIDEADFWIQAEKGVDRERQKIWESET
jgi:hypothetical protein